MVIDDGDGASANGSISGAMSLTDPDESKRANHNALERKRRIFQKERLQELKDCVPTIKSEKPSTVEILQRSTEYIAYMKQRHQTQEAEIRTLRRQNAALAVKLGGGLDADVDGDAELPAVSANNVDLNVSTTVATESEPIMRVAINSLVSSGTGSSSGDGGGNNGSSCDGGVGGSVTTVGAASGGNSSAGGLFPAERPRPSVSMSSESGGVNGMLESWGLTPKCAVETLVEPEVVETARPEDAELLQVFVHRVRRDSMNAAAREAAERESAQVTSDLDIKNNSASDTLANKSNTIAGSKRNVNRKRKNDPSSAKVSKKSRGSTAAAAAAANGRLAAQSGDDDEDGDLDVES